MSEAHREEDDLHQQSVADYSETVIAGLITRAWQQYRFTPREQLKKVAAVYSRSQYLKRDLKYVTPAARTIDDIVMMFGSDVESRTGVVIGPEFTPRIDFHFDKYCVSYYSSRIVLYSTAEPPIINPLTCHTKDSDGLLDHASFLGFRTQLSQDASLQINTQPNAPLPARFAH